MSCFRPNIVKSCVDDYTGAIKSVFLGSDEFADPLTFGTPYLDKEWLSFVPCGKCLGCRLDYARQWADRMLLELYDSKSAIFVTLTYDNDNLPVNDLGYGTLNKVDVQKFFKRLRKAFPDKKIRYYLAGEYGSKTFRPHYHAIIFNLDLADFSDLCYRGTNDIGCSFYSSDIFSKIWSHGFILLSSVNWRTCNYVARYTMKKQYFFDSDEYKMVEPPFNLSSRRPGIGMNYAKQLISSGDAVFPLSSSDGVHTIPIPTSIIKRFKENNAFCIDLLNELVYTRTTIARANIEAKLLASGLTYRELLLLEKSNLESRINLLPERR